MDGGMLRAPWGPWVDEQPMFDQTTSNLAIIHDNPLVVDDFPTKMKSEEGFSMARLDYKRVDWVD